MDGKQSRPYIHRPEEPGMSTFIERYRQRRKIARRLDAIDRAIAKNPSTALRDELHAMMSRD